MKTKFNFRTLPVRAGVLTALCCSFLCSAVAQGNKVDVSALTRETQKSINQEHQLSFVWWIPEDFWRATMTANPESSPKQTESFLKVIHPYTLVAVVDGDIGPFGGVTYKSEKTIRSQLTILDSNGKEYKPLDNTDVSEDLQNLLASMKPMLANMLGPMGKNFNFYVFPGMTKNDKVIVDAKAEGTFTVQSGDRAFKWRLPLGSLLAPKTCPKCNESLNGAFKFCPYDGTALK